MNLRDSILAEHSKANCNRIVKWIGSDQLRFDALFALFLHDEPVVMQRAAWPMSNSVIAHPQLVHKHFAKLLSNLTKPHLHTAIKRNTLRLLEDVDIPKRYHGKLMNTCFNYILTPDEKPAVKASALSILQKLSFLYPGIKAELTTIIRDRWEFESAAFRSRAKKILHQSLSGKVVS
jgi:hypothetical protein